MQNGWKKPACGLMERVSINPSPQRVANPMRNPLEGEGYIGGRWNPTSPPGTREFVPVLLKTGVNASWIPFYARATSRRADGEAWGRYGRDYSDCPVRFVRAIFRSEEEKRAAGYGSAPQNGVCVVDPDFFERHWRLPVAF